jgi:protein dithiol oxidoreductase (disulfide-forming)
MPNRLIGFLLLGLVAACSAESPATQAPAAVAPSFQAGTDYFLIEPAQPTQSGERIEVLEVFGYSCIHCANLQPILNEWKATLPADVQFDYMPAVFGGVWEVFARAYYTAQTMGVLERSHDALFEAIHGERRQFRSVEDVAGFYDDYGVSQAQFLATMSSFPVEAKISHARAQVPAYGVDATPTMVVAGKYRVPAGSGGFERMLKVVDHLVERERVERR